MQLSIYNMSQHQGAIVSNGNGVAAASTHSPVPKGTPIPAHDLNGMSNGLSNGIGANPRPGWSQCECRQ